MPSLSVCMMVQNSEKTLAIALESLANVYDELIIVDGGSSDSTCEIASRYGARIIHSEWTGNHSQQRNVYLREIKTDWVFIIDSDEFIDTKTLDFLQQVKQPENSLISDNFWIPRKWISPFNKEQYIASSPHFPDFQLRLFKHNKSLSYKGLIHEELQGLKSSGLPLKELSIYHLDLFINSEEKRLEKVIKYNTKGQIGDGITYFYLPDLNELILKKWNFQKIIPSVYSLLETLNSDNMPPSDINRIIPPEIKDDEFYSAIKRIAQDENIQTVLEIGSSSGEGSTEAFVRGLRKNPNKPTLFCMEVSKPRFENLQKRYANDSFVKCYNASSVSLEQFPDEQEIVTFYKTKKTALNNYPLETVLSWLRQDIEYVEQSGGEVQGIEKIKRENNIEFFDVVLIDGSEFTGSSELDATYGAHWILLDDINTFKNYENYQKLLLDRHYTLLEKNYHTRNGYAIFKKINFSFQPETKEQLNVKKQVRTGMTVLDIGANFVDYSLLFSELVGNSGKVYSFKSELSAFIKTQNCINEFNLQNLYLWPNENLGKNSIDQQEIIDRAEAEIEKGIILDSFCEKYNIQSIDFLKLDSSPIAKTTLLGAIDLFKQKAIRFIQFEINQEMLDTSNDTAKNILDLLNQNDYECHRIEDNGDIGKEVIESKFLPENYMAFPAFPIHFFTIVLNGEPFIRYHIDILKQLPFKWHWHIVEGVADLKHDTAWSLNMGGGIADEIHRNGRSKDSTSEYLDELAQLYPENITIYRKTEGIFWDGKREMVNAPLANISEECLLWQVDVDELWTVDQICKARLMFLNNPEKTAAFYWCWYFVGENLIISTRNCYAENPAQDWLRTWRFKPGMRWVAHEPPTLAELLSDGQWQDVAKLTSFEHEETEKQGLVFQHFAYVTPEQLRFKEQYYGYANAVSQWTSLQDQTKFPVLLRQYFSWVRDATMVDTTEACGIVPIAQKDSSSNVWQFVQIEEPQKTSVETQKRSPTILVDSIFFQFYKTGIARVWRSLLEEWVKTGFAKHIVVIDRAGTAPEIPGLRYCLVPPYDYENTASDRAMLQQVCDEESADLFISTYYTTPLSTTSVFMAYDMIPEVWRADLREPMWREKHYGIRHASAYIAISENTARDLVKFFPEISPDSVTVAYCGVADVFSPAIPEEISRFKTKYGISKPYFMAVGIGDGYKNTGLFFKAIAQLCSRQGFEIICTGSGGLLSPEFRAYTSGIVVHLLQLNDEELKAAYSGAIALVYPSKYEGFGLPVLEAMSCGCPVVTCANASIPEVAGESALYVNDEDVNELTNALCEVQKPDVRHSLIAAGLERARKFSWSSMAEKVSLALIEATLFPLKLKNINLIAFPDWEQPEESLSSDLEEVLRAVVTHPEKSQMTLLLDISNISEEDANLFLSSITMNLFMQEELDVTDGPEISLVGQLGERQWEVLLPRLQARIVLENENQQAIARSKAQFISSATFDSLSNKRFI